MQLHVVAVDSQQRSRLVLVRAAQLLIAAVIAALCLWLCSPAAASDRLPCGSQRPAARNGFVTVENWLVCKHGREEEPHGVRTLVGTSAVVASNSRAVASFSF